MKMTHTISDRQVKNLFNKVTKSTSKAEILTLFKKYFPSAFNETSKAEKKTAETSSKLTKVNGYRIVWAKGGGKVLSYPSSKYQKNTPIEAATSAMKGIIRKKENGLKTAEAKFSFIIQNGDGPKYTYSVTNGKLAKVSATSLTKSPIEKPTSWF